MNHPNSLRAILLDKYRDHYRAVGRYWRDAPGQIRRPTARRFDRSFGFLVRQLPDRASVLDLGCGDGVLLAWLRRYRNVVPVGVDICEASVTAARDSLPGLEIHCADGRQFLESQTNRFSGIFCFDVLEHIPDEQLVWWMQAVYNALKPGGFFCCRAPNAAHLFGPYCRYKDLTHVRAFTSYSLIQLLESFGFIESRVIPLKPGSLVMALQTLVEYAIHKTLFLACGHPEREVFTSNVYAVGFRPVETHTGSLQSASSSIASSREP